MLLLLLLLLLPLWLRLRLRSSVIVEHRARMLTFSQLPIKRFGMARVGPVKVQGSIECFGMSQVKPVMNGAGPELGDGMGRLCLLLLAGVAGKPTNSADFGTASDGFGMDRAGIVGSRSQSWVCSVCSINCWAAGQVLQTSCCVPTRDCELPPVCSEAPLPSTHLAGIACEALELRAKVVAVVEVVAAVVPVAEVVTIATILRSHLIFIHALSE